MFTILILNENKRQEKDKCVNKEDKEREEIKRETAVEKEREEICSPRLLPSRLIRLTPRIIFSCSFLSVFHFLFNK